MQRLGEKIDFQARGLEEECKNLRLELQKNQQESQQVTKSLQQCRYDEEQNRLENAAHVALLQAQIQKMRDAANATSLESSAAVERLRDVQSTLEEQHKELALIRQERTRVEVEHQQKTSEKDEVTGSTRRVLHETLWSFILNDFHSPADSGHSSLGSAAASSSGAHLLKILQPSHPLRLISLSQLAVQREHATKVSGEQRASQIETGSTQDVFRQVSSKPSMRAPPPPTAPPEHIQQQSIRSFMFFHLCAPIVQHILQSTLQRQCAALPANIFPRQISSCSSCRIGHCSN